MKSIEERALEKFPVVLISEEMPKDLFKAYRQVFIDGAESEHEELTKWNNPIELPNHDDQVLGKLKAGGYKLIRKDSNQGVFIDLKTYLIVWPGDLIGWREIHE